MPTPRLLATPIRSIPVAVHLCAPRCGHAGDLRSPPRHGRRGRARGGPRDAANLVGADNRTRGPLSTIATCPPPPANDRRTSALRRAPEADADKGGGHTTPTAGRFRAAALLGPPPPHARHARRSRDAAFRRRRQRHCRAGSLRALAVVGRISLSCSDETPPWHARQGHVVACADAAQEFRPQFEGGLAAQQTTQSGWPTTPCGKPCASCCTDCRDVLTARHSTFKIATHPVRIQTLDRRQTQASSSKRKSYCRHVGAKTRARTGFAV